MTAPQPPPPPPPELDELTREMLHVMRRVPLLEDLSEDLLVRIASESDLKKVRAGETVCREGECGSVFWVILAGLVKILKKDETGKSVKIVSLGEGSFFGEMGPMSAQPRTATCVAEVDGYLLEVPEETFFFFRDKVPSFKKQIDEAYRARALITHLTIAPLFKGISRATLQTVVDVSTLATVAKDRVVVAEGQASEAFYLVRHGYLRVTRRRGDREEIVAYLRDNTYFGEQALLGGGAEVTTVATMAECELVVISRDVFDIVSAKHPELDARRKLLGEKQQERLCAMTAVGDSGKMEVMIRRGLVQAREALVIDTKKCTKCEMCVQSCSAVHGGHPLIQLTGMRIGDLLLPASCYNCKTPDCMLACRFGCITRDRQGLIFINEDTCTGCTLCSRKCPYGTIFMVDREEEGDEDQGFFKRVLGALRRRKEPVELAAPPEMPAKAVAGQGGPPPAERPSGAPAVAAATAKAPKNQPDQPKGAKKAKRLAVKCDLCMGHGFTACVYNCPTGAIERVSPERLMEIM